MATRIHFDEVRNNNIKSFLLVFLFFLVVAIIGYFVGLIWGNPIAGLIFTLVIGVIYSLIAYFQGKNMVMKMAGAKKVKKKDYPHLFHTVEGLALAAGIPTPECYVIESKAPNAFATGRSHEEGAIAVTTGLLDKLNREEVEGVVAHEIAHIKNYDIRTMMLAAVLAGVIVFLSHVLIRSFFFSGSGGRDGRAQLILFFVGLVLAILAPIFAEMIKMAISRKNEYSADARAAVLTRNPKGLANALRKISGDSSKFDNVNRGTAHMYIDEPYEKKGFVGNLFSTHPPTEERIKRLEAM